MSTNAKNILPTIDPDALDAVVGGRRSASSSTRDDRIMDALGSLESSIRDLGRNQNTAPDPMSQMLPFLMLSMMNQPPAPAAAPAPTVIVQQGRKGKKGW